MTRIIITGAASGIGRACAFAVAEAARARGETPRLLLVDRAADAVAAIADEMIASDIIAASYTADLSDVTAGDAIASRAREVLGGVDILISNAGVFGNSPLETLDLESWDANFAVNTRATWLLAKACYPMLAEKGGAIVATASISASQPTPPHGAYSASKAALVMLVRQMAYEWGPAGIRANCVSPGMVHTAMTDAIYSNPEKRAERASHIPLRRVATPEDIARVITFLAGPDSGYVTGVDLAVDGGVQTSLMPTLRRASVPGETIQ